jgi:ABC-type nitrate/sulfonate/bicarbonate transport system substrate-binding protein
MHYLVAKPQFNSVEELRGKTLAINSFGASEQLTLWALLKAHGIDPDKKDVQVIAIATARCDWKRSSAASSMRRWC